MGIKECGEEGMWELRNVVAFIIYFMSSYKLTNIQILRVYILVVFLRERSNKYLQFFLLTCLKYFIGANATVVTLFVKNKFA